MPWSPTQLGLNPAWINGVAPVMARTIRDHLDQIVVGRLSGNQMIEMGADAFHNLTVGAFPISTNAIAASGCSVAGCKQKSIHMILHEQPIANI